MVCLFFFQPDDPATPHDSNSKPVEQTVAETQPAAAWDDPFADGSGAPTFFDASAPFEAPVASKVATSAPTNASAPSTNDLFDFDGPAAIVPPPGGVRRGSVTKRPPAPVVPAKFYFDDPFADPPPAAVDDPFDASGDPFSSDPFATPEVHTPSAPAPVDTKTVRICLIF